MTAMDAITMTAVIIGEIWMSLNLAGTDARRSMFSFFGQPFAGFNILFYILFAISSYLFLVTIVMMCLTARKTLFYQRRAGKLLTLLFGILVYYIMNLVHIVLAPFGSLYKFGVFHTITVHGVGAIMYILIILIQAGVLFFITSALMERKMNI
jgi:hypothetical protein